MKTKRTLAGQHFLTSLGDTEGSLERVEELLPMIGEVVVFFNALESTLDSCLCEIFSDRSDQKGLLVLHTMMFSTKVDLYERFRLDLYRAFEWDPAECKQLLTKLRECGTLRNRIVHARWDTTDETGYTHVRFRISKDGLEHEQTLFSSDYMENAVESILVTTSELGEFDIACIEKLARS